MPLSILNPYVMLAGIGLLALSNAFSFNAGMRHAQNVAAVAAAKDATRIVKDKAKSDAELRAMPEKDLCRELNGGRACE